MTFNTNTIADELFYLKQYIIGNLMHLLKEPFLRRMAQEKQKALYRAWCVGSLLRGGKDGKSPESVKAAMGFQVYSGSLSVLSQDEIDMVEAGFRADADAMKRIMEEETGLDSFEMWFKKGFNDAERKKYAPLLDKWIADGHLRFA